MGGLMISSLPITCHTWSHIISICSLCCRSGLQFCKGWVLGSTQKGDERFDMHYNPIQHKSAQRITHATCKWLHLMHLSTQPCIILDLWWTLRWQFSTCIQQKQTQACLSMIKWLSWYSWSEYCHEYSLSTVWVQSWYSDLLPASTEFTKTTRQVIMRLIELRDLKATVPAGPYTTFPTCLERQWSLSALAGLLTLGSFLRK